MAERIFCPAESWIDTVVDFEEVDDNTNISLSKQWQIVEKLEERNDQGDKVEWEDFGQQPMMAIALFECVTHNNPSESALMKVYIQYEDMSHISIIY
jgi:hypothetical protein